MEENKNNSNFNEIDELDYMENALHDLKSNFEDHESFSKGTDYIEENLWEKVERVGKKISFTKDIKALFKYFRDKDVPWYRKTIIVGALIYFILPIDTIPDFSPFIGYLDDLGVITAVLKYLGKEIIPYYEK
jgi:uncharacterized membrane protein YkvA (DUF1232 family)